MSKFEKYKGIIPAFYACYDDKGNVSPERVEKLALYYLEAGVKGLYVGGSSGECIYQNVEERKLVLEHVMKAVGGKLTIIAHIAAPSTRDSIELAKHAASLGVDALAAIPPIYFRLPEYSIEKYWKEMVEAGGNTDFIIYNIPQTTGYALSTDLLLKMLEDERVIGVKNSSMPVQDIITFKLAAKRDIVVFNGPDEQYVAGRLVGADGGIGGTYGAMPQLFLAADKALADGDFAKAQAIQNKITEIIFLICTAKGNLYDVIKQVLARNGLNIGRVRGPLTACVAEDEQIIIEVDKAIKDAINTFC